MERGTRYKSCGIVNVYYTQPQALTWENIVDFLFLEKNTILSTPPAPIIHVRASNAARGKCTTKQECVTLYIPEWQSPERGGRQRQQNGVRTVHWLGVNRKYGRERGAELS